MGKRRVSFDARRFSTLREFRNSCRHCRNDELASLNLERERERLVIILEHCWPKLVIAPQANIRNIVRAPLYRAISTALISAENSYEGDNDYRLLKRTVERSKRIAWCSNRDPRPISSRVETSRAHRCLLVHSIVRVIRFDLTENDKIHLESSRHAS